MTEQPTGPEKSAFREISSPESIAGCYGDYAKSYEYQKCHVCNSANDCQSQAAFSKKYVCREMLTYFPWVFSGANFKDLEPSIVFSLLRHARHCSDCAIWLKDIFHFKTVAEAEDCMRWVYAGKPKNWRPRP
jgi:hypothetical protein